MYPRNWFIVVYYETIKQEINERLIITSFVYYKSIKRGLWDFLESMVGGLLVVKSGFIVINRIYQFYNNILV